MEDNSDMADAPMIPKDEYSKKRVYVSKIPRGATKSDVAEVFSKYGEVSCKFIQYFPQSRSSFSFVNFSQEEDAKRAVEAGENSEIVLDDQTLFVNFARKKSNRKKNNKKSKKSASKDEEITGPSLIDKLDDDSLVEIFLYLSMKQRLEMEDVCVRWRNVSKRAWHDIRNLEFRSSLATLFFSPHVNQKFIQDVLERCGRYLNTLVIDSMCTSTILRTIRRHCHNLTKIELRFTRYNVKHFSNAFSQMSKLQSFTLTNSEPRFLRNSLLSLPETVRSIHMAAELSTGVLDFSYKSLSADTSVFFQKFTDIDSLTIKGYAFKRHLIETMSQKNTITHLSLAYGEIKKGINLLLELSNLEHLDLERVHAVNNFFLGRLSTSCQKLKYLNVSRCIQLSDAGIRHLVNLENLEELQVNDMANSVSDLSIGQLEGIKKLECEHCLEVRDPGIIQLMNKCPDLEKLNVAGTSVSELILHVATSVTKRRQNAIVLHLIADLFQMEFDIDEDPSPYLTIEASISDIYPSDSEDEYDDYEDYSDYEDYEGYENYEGYEDNGSMMDDEYGDHDFDFFDHRFIDNL